MTPEAVERFRREFASRQAADDRDRRSRDADLRKPLAREQKAIDGCTRAIRVDHATPSVYAALKDAEDKKAALDEEVANFSTAAPEIAPDTAELYRAQVEALAELLSDPEIVQRASEILGELIEGFTVPHDAELGHTAQIEGKLLGLRGFAGSKNAAALSGAACSVKVVAGAGNCRILPALSAII